MLFCLFAVISISAQTTAFTYQGSLKEGASAANGNYDFEFKLFDLASGGAPQGGTLQQLNVAVANGIFAVSLDFGAAPLPGANRFLEIGVRMNGNPGGFQQLLPRQKVGSSPYAVQSLNAATAANATTATTATNATQLGGVAANQYRANWPIRVYRMPAIRSPASSATIFKIKTPAAGNRAISTSAATGQRAALFRAAWSTRRPSTTLAATGCSVQRDRSISLPESAREP